MKLKPHKGNSFAALLFSVTLLLGFLPAVSTYSAQLPSPARTEWISNKNKSARAFDYQQFKKAFQNKKIFSARNGDEYILRLMLFDDKITTRLHETIRQGVSIISMQVRRLLLKSTYKTSKEGLPFTT
jgi:hypothetical protein